jgi:hypothetical protein
VQAPALYYWIKKGKEMLYLLKRIERADYDEYEGFVVSADNAQEARLIAATWLIGDNPLTSHETQKDRLLFLDDRQTTCEHLTEGGEKGIILDSYISG